jgi:hypothetical protein
MRYGDLIGSGKMFDLMNNAMLAIILFQTSVCFLARCTSLLRWLIEQRQRTRAIYSTAKFEF